MTHPVEPKRYHILDTVSDLSAECSRLTAELEKARRKEYLALLLVGVCGYIAGVVVTIVWRWMVRNV